MTTGGFQTAFNEAQIIGENVYNFFPSYQKYKDIFEKEIEKDGKKVKVDREYIKINHPSLLKQYDELQYYKTMKDIVCIYTSAQAAYSSTRYDITHGKIIDDCFKVVDRDTGDTHYIAIDQINVIIRYNKDEKCYDYDRKTGEIKEMEINKDKPRNELFYAS